MQNECRHYDEDVDTVVLVSMIILGIFAFVAFVRGVQSSAKERTAPEPEPEPQARPTPKQELRPRTVQDHTTTLRRSDYLPHGDELTYFEEGRQVRLLEVTDWLVMVTDDGQIVNPHSTQLYKAGIFSFGIRGTSYYVDAVTQGDFSPGTPLRLEREPNNPHDPNAVAIYAPGATEKAGYVNKLNAKRIAAILDSGTDLVCISISGDGPGQFEIVPNALVTDPDTLQRLMP